MKISDAFHLMAKPTGPICNLDCEYCFYLEKEKLYAPKNNWAMPGEVLEKYIKEFIETQNIPTITFAWQGGEPTLLGIEFFKNAVKLQQKYSNGKKIENTFQTNGILLNDKWGEFLAENNFLVGLSIDGPREIHNKYRIHKGGQPSFDKVINGLSYLKNHKVEFNTLTCVQIDNSYKPLEVYNFLKEIGSRFMQFIPIVERKAANVNGTELDLVSSSYKENALVTDWSVESLQYGKFMMAIFDYWVRNDIGNYFVQLFDVCLGIWFGQEASLCIFKETCGQALALEHNGDVYSCDHFVYPENKLQNIMQESLKKIVDSEKQVRFGLDKKNKLPQYCLDCDVRFACNGECPKNRFINTPDGEPGLNYLCAGYKYFFHGIAPYMRFMANELANKRAPANVINWAKEKDKGFPGIKINRNDLCICGSGIKFKNCCGKNRKEY
jgi:serine-type anaerobic sulfatase-maturating enzyme